MKKFSETVANFLADKMWGFKFDLADEKQFFRFPTPVKLNGLTFSIYAHKSVLPITVNQVKPEDLIYFTYFVGRSDDEIKSRLGTDQDLLHQYSTAFTPSSVDYQNLCSQLKTLLEEHIYAGENFDFTLLFTAPNGDLDPVTVFLDSKSVEKLQDKFPKELVLNLSLSEANAPSTS